MYSIKRHIEGVVERRSKNSKAILLTGPRQVGKSTLYKHLFGKVNQVTLYTHLVRKELFLSNVNRQNKFYKQMKI